MNVFEQENIYDEILSGLEKMNSSEEEIMTFKFLWNDFHSLSYMIEASEEEIKGSINKFPNLSGILERNYRSVLEKLKKVAEDLRSKGYDI